MLGKVFFCNPRWHMARRPRRRWLPELRQLVLKRAASKEGVKPVYKCGNRELLVACDAIQKGLEAWQAKDNWI